MATTRHRAIGPFRRIVLATIALTVVVFPVADAGRAEDRFPGGPATGPVDDGPGAFGHPSAMLGPDDLVLFREGQGIFRRLWVAAPAITQASDGLGPLYNGRSCQSCHFRDGRSHPPDSATGAGSADSLAAQVVLQLARPVADGAPRPDPTYGRQLQALAIPGHVAEYRLSVRWENAVVTLEGGETVTLRRPVWGIGELSRGPLDPATVSSARVAQQLIGLGLLEAIPEADILAAADPDDADGDGIAGRAHILSPAGSGGPTLGRFGHKAARPSVHEQVAAALSRDMGLSTPLFPAPWGDCTARQGACRSAPQGGSEAPPAPEVPQDALDALVHYTRHLAVPPRRDPSDPEVLRGQEVFHRSGCAGCHTPSQVIGPLPGNPDLGRQTIWPYTDLLLHDMGDGLADAMPEGAASGRAWRTAPLWGIGLTEVVTGKAGFLHDGRARSLLEAILWHGGTAAPARDRVIALSPAERAALLRFVGSL